MVEVVCVVCERKEEEEEEEKEKENSICCCHLDNLIWPKKKPQQKSEHNHYNTIKIHPHYVHQTRSDSVLACTGSNEVDLREQWHFEINSTTVFYFSYRPI